MAKKTKVKKIISKFEKNFTFSFLRLFIFIILVAGIGCTYLVKSPIENFVADVFNVNLTTTEHGQKIEAGDLEVHFIDVGQGDCIVIRFPDDKTMIIDAGDKDAHKVIIPYLNSIFFKENEKKEFDYALVTHSHEDHCGSMDEIYAEYQINYSIRPYEYSTRSECEIENNTYGALERNTVVYSRYIDAVYNENDFTDNRDIIYANAGLTITSDDSTKPYLLEFITPNKKYYDNPNDYSPIVLLEYQELSMLFTGDAAEEQVEELEEILFNNLTLSNRMDRITVYKAMHHGSILEESNRLSLLKMLNPEYVVIQVGEDNSYQHPHQGFLDALVQANVKTENIYRNDLNKNIVFGISSNATVESLLNIVSDIEVDPNASQVSSSDSEIILYYAWWIFAGALVFLCAVICFYNYGYKKRNAKVRAYEKGE